MRIDGCAIRTQVQQTFTVFQLNPAGNVRGDCHGQVKHAHQEALSLNSRTVGTFADGCPGPDRHVKLGPAVQDMMVMENDMAEITRGVFAEKIKGRHRISVGVIHLDEQAHG